MPPTFRTGPVLLTGGSGRLGTELRAALPGLVAPTSTEMDVTDPAAVSATFSALKPGVVIHAAAYTDVARAERERDRCWNVNVGGTRNVARAAQQIGARLVLISTDYVFYGDRGNYHEDDTPGPVRNFYALTKLVAEEAARAVPGALVIRTSFRPRVWPYETAFDDVFTSQDYVDVIAPLLVDVFDHLAQIDVGLLHVGTERKSVFELAARRAPAVRRASRSTAPVALPEDVSLDVGRFARMAAAWRR